MRPVRKMTANVGLAVRTTLRGPYSDGSLRFRNKTRSPQSLSQLDAQPASAAHNSCLLQRLELFRISTTWYFSIEHATASISTPIHSQHSQHPVQHPALSVAIQPATHPISLSLSADSDRTRLHPFLSH